MQQIIFEIEKNEDAELLMAIADRMGVKNKIMKKRNKTGEKASQSTIEMNEKASVTGDSSTFIKGDHSIEISDLQTLFTEKILNASHLRKSLWQREK